MDIEGRCSIVSGIRLEQRGQVGSVVMHLWNRLAFVARALWQTDQRKGKILGTSCTAHIAFHNSLGG